MGSFAQTQFQTLFAYHWHTTRRLLDCAANLNPAEVTANPGYGQGSIHTIFFHLLRTDYLWRVRLETGERPQPPAIEAYPTLESLREGFESEAQAWQAFLERLTEEEIMGGIRLADRHGAMHDFLRWRILQHVILHGMQHHAELAQLLTAKGQSLGDIDFIFFG